MGNGFAGYGAVSAEIQNTTDHQIRKGKLSVRSAWSSSGNWIELGWWPTDGSSRKLEFDIAVDQDNDDAVELVAALLEAIGKRDMAETLRADSVKLAERAVIRQRADEQASSKAQEARAAFLAATSDQRMVFDADMDEIDEEYERTTGEVLRQSRFIDWQNKAF